MKAIACVALVACFSVLSFGLDVSVASSLDDDMATLTQSGKIGPVNKVIAILKDMLKTLEKEAAEDEEIYDKLTCWCSTNEKEKSKSIADAEARISALTTKIEEATAESARLNTEISNLEKEVAGHQQALDKAKSIRTKQLAEFNAEEKDMLESLAALKQAITVLSKHHSGFLQLPPSHLMGFAAMLQNEMKKHAPLLKGVITPTQKKMVETLVQSGSKDGYAPQSGEIFGILTTMKETFEENLSSAQKEEAENQKAFEDMKAAKTEQIEAGQSQIDAKTQELAATDEENAQAKVDRKDTSQGMAADQKFMMKLEETCSMTDKEWELRTKTRQEEMEAVSKALAMLNSDEAHDLLSSKSVYGFVQKAATVKSSHREQASKLLADMAKKLNSPKLANLAYQVKLDAFTRVKKIIDDMVANLLKEKQDEIDHKKFCVEELNTNAQQTAVKEDEKSDLLTKISDLEQKIQDLTDAIASLKSQISEMGVQLKQAGEDRERENNAFQKAIADQRATQKLLEAALSVLGKFYNTKAAMLQTAKQEPPAGFKAYEKSASSGGVMKLMQEIIDDAKNMEAESIRAEEDSQKAYEDYVKDTNGSIEAKTKDLANKSEDKAQAEAALVDAKKARDAVLLELEQLANFNSELHESCDYVMKNFEVRQTARDEEIEALKQAKAILSGAKFDDFLQTGQYA